MRFHHMAIFVSDLDEAIHLWRDVMGFDVAINTVIPDGDAPGPNTYMYPKLLDDIFKVKGARSKMALLSSKEGALIELQECENPAIKRTPPENLRYGHTGFHELGLVCDDIDGFFTKVRAAGYETQTEYVWQCANIGRSFLFYDKDGNMIQMWEHIGGDPTWT
ncbi:MAG: catechol 2,3-dioxygenase-like lactoylglutathione lyase family enzyme [Gammaproteobacteria bacterium]|jgi:catechol 2,3-dioxygenase-like lactoylglutathione lyase family enzyme